ncbi:hypothetical protein CesoFtcFv8_026768 [Champsocephalus esox]|uniref:Uncharacterized protein n=1 Tax=Champsocephalus esox TaxID=159716 RepID=A0AAN8G9C5_9TELE|nr:hypothetical protein CesoFtcFv8_026768 [Champsocephalus esox]
MSGRHGDKEVPREGGQREQGVNMQALETYRPFWVSARVRKKESMTHADERNSQNDLGSERVGCVSTVACLTAV